MGCPSRHPLNSTKLTSGAIASGRSAASDTPTITRAAFVPGTAGASEPPLDTAVPGKGASLSTTTRRNSGGFSSRYELCALDRRRLVAVGVPRGQPFWSKEQSNKRLRGAAPPVASRISDRVSRAACYGCLVDGFASDLVRPQRLFDPRWGPLAIRGVLLAVRSISGRRGLFWVCGAALKTPRAEARPALRYASGRAVLRAKTASSCMVLLRSAVLGAGWQLSPEGRGDCGQPRAPPGLNGGSNSRWRRGRHS